MSFDKEYYETLVCAVNIRKEIEALFEQDLELEDLPPSILPTWLVWNLVLCYEEIYNKLEAQNLIKSGNHKQHKGIQ